MEKYSFSGKDIYYLETTQIALPKGVMNGKWRMISEESLNCIFFAM